jgi:hypothetical protein
MATTATVAGMGIGAGIEERSVVRGCQPIGPGRRWFCIVDFDLHVQNLVFLAFNYFSERRRNASPINNQANKMPVAGSGIIIPLAGPGPVP